MDAQVLTSYSVFMSYSRKDKECVFRLAEDLLTKVAGVWVDQNFIQAGQKWRKEIEQAICNSKVVILVLSPDSANSKNVDKEVAWAQKHQKMIIPVLYRRVKKYSGRIDKVVHQTQYIDLSCGSFEENFQKLLAGLVEAGVALQDHAVSSRPLCGPVKTHWGAVVLKIPGWGIAWSLGWGVFWPLIMLLFMVLQIVLESGSFRPLENVVRVTVAFAIGGGLGGLAGGLFAGLGTMVTLRRYARSISWKHISPSILSWIKSGILGAIASAVILLIINIATGSIGSQIVACSRLTQVDCMSQILVQTLHAVADVVVLATPIFFLILLAIWFLAGAWAGWRSVKHISHLEQGIQLDEAFWVMFAWGLGALVAGVGTVWFLQRLIQAL